MGILFPRFTRFSKLSIGVATVVAIVGAHVEAAAPLSYDRGDAGYLEPQGEIAIARTNQPVKVRMLSQTVAALTRNFDALSEF